MRFLNFHLSAALVALIVSLAFNPTVSAAEHPNLKGEWESFTDTGKKIGPAEIRQGHRPHVLQRVAEGRREIHREGQGGGC